MYANWIQKTGGSDRFRMDEAEAHSAITKLIASAVIEGKIEELKLLKDNCSEDRFGRYITSEYLDDCLAELQAQAKKDK
jgi:hypothetical protein